MNLDPNIRVTSGYSASSVSIKVPIDTNPAYYVVLESTNSSLNIYLFIYTFLNNETSRFTGSSSSPFLFLHLVLALVLDILCNIRPLKCRYEDGPSSTCPYYFYLSLHRD